ncbi:hypothetical protein CDAR_191001 [Caerostris darwini]|uniref:Uncharacterized protein n=1 Tax=Caerostris darwini TaxID=1538125 RepID=A0AAV4VBF4_9ARAC|nr:hypothetical protein CDAR_191001 [Caerostris darwini]
MSIFPNKICFLKNNPHSSSHSFLKIYGTNSDRRTAVGKELTSRIQRICRIVPNRKNLSNSSEIYFHENTVWFASMMTDFEEENEIIFRSMQKIEKEACSVLKPYLEFGRKSCLDIYLKIKSVTTFDLEFIKP